MKKVIVEICNMALMVTLFVLLIDIADNVSKNSTNGIMLMVSITLTIRLILKIFIYENDN